MNILIAVPTYDSIEPDCFKSIYNLLWPQDCAVTFNYIKGYDCARTRNMIAKEAIDNNYDYVLMVDSDIVVPQNTLIALFEAQKDIIAGWYTRKRTLIGQTELYSLGEKDFTDKNNINEKDIIPNQILEIKGCGMGCAFIKVDLFHKIGQSKWYEYIEYPNGTVLSEDLCFCSKLNKLNIPIFCHTGIKCGHINKFIL